MKGVGWVERNVLAGMAIYRRSIAVGEIESEFASRHATTLGTIAGLSKPADAAAPLLQRMALEAGGN